jgi:hypothetical protein
MAPAVRKLALSLAVASLYLCWIGLTNSLPASCEGQPSGNSPAAYYSYPNLEKLLNQEEKTSQWRNGLKNFNQAAQTAPAVGGESRYSFRQPQAFDRNLHAFFPWHKAQGAQPTPAGYSGYAVSGSSGVQAGTQAAGNPFNLSPFGVLHYLWDPTVYTSSSNPVSLVEVRSQLQIAQQQSALAQAAAARSKYANTPAERQQAAALAQQYAALARQAAQRAQSIAEAGSSNPADVAALASDEAGKASAAAHQAARSATGLPW